MTDASDDLEGAILEFDLEGWALARGAKPVGRSDRALELVMGCPTCGKPKLCIQVERKAWHCWICQRYEPGPGGRRRAVAGAGGLLDLIALVDGLNRNDARRLVLRSAPGVGHIPEAMAPRDRFQAPRAPRALAYPEAWRPVTVPLPWMDRRRLALEDAQAYGLGWCSSGKYASRMVFPVSEQGLLVYWQARAMWEPRPGETYVKALNPPRDDGAASSELVLFGLEQVVRHGFRRVAVVEGPMDCIRAGPDAVATFGKRITPTQIGKLVAAGVREVDLMWDADAWPEVHAAAPFLRGFFDRVRAVYLPYGDPDPLERSVLRQLRDQA